MKVSQTRYDEICEHGGCFGVRKTYLLWALISMSIVLCATLIIVPTLPAEEPSPTNFEEVLKTAIHSNTEIQSVLSKGEALRGLVDQANLLPNPEVEVELENFSGTLPGTDQSEFTTSIGQLIETAGKRSARTHLAQAERESYLLNARIAIEEIIGSVKLAYQRTLFAQAQKSLAEEQVQLAEEMYSTVKKKLKFGGVLQVELTKAEIALHSAQVQLTNMKQALEEAKNTLASFWGGDGTMMGHLPPLPSHETENIASIPFKIERSPFYKLSEAKLRTAIKNYKNERALIYPNITARAGYRRIEETGNNTFIASLAVPLPIFNRNQGAVRHASHLEQAAKQSHINTTRKLHARFLNRRKRLSAQVSEQKLLKTSILPQSKKALKQVKSAYSLGKSSYLDLLDSQRRYIEARERELIVSSSAYDSMIELQKIMGTILHDRPLNTLLGATK